MPAKIPDEPENDGKATKAVRLRLKTAVMLEEISEATGQPLWKTVERLLGPGLPHEHKQILPRLKKVREQAAKIAEEQRQALKELGG